MTVLHAPDCRVPEIVDKTRICICASRRLNNWTLFASKSNEQIWYNRVGELAERS